LKTNKVTFTGEDVHRCDDGIGRATPGPFDHAVHLVGLSLHHCFHRAIKAVADLYNDILRAYAKTLVPIQPQVSLPIRIR